MLSSEEEQRLIQATTYLSGKPPTLYRSGCLIRHEELKRLSEYSPSAVVRLFEVSTDFEKVSFQIEMTCSGCGDVSLALLTRTKVISALSIHRGSVKFHHRLLCPKCDGEKRQNDSRAIAKSAADHQEQVRGFSTRFIESYLNPSNRWNTPQSKWWRELISATAYVSDKAIKDAIKALKYREFLETPYWKAITAHVRYKAVYKCQMCNAPNGLQVHHRSYQNHGEEHNHLEDLICICSDCHTRHHFPAPDGI